MIKRIVILELQTENIEEFRTIFITSQATILSQPGCHAVSLHRDLYQTNLYYTVSMWEDEVALNAYRKSDFFGTIWPRTKRLLLRPADAITMQESTATINEPSNDK